MNNDEPENIEQDKADKQNATDTYDTLMNCHGSVAEGLDNVLAGDKRERIAKLIMQIESYKGKDLQGKMELARVIVDSVTDDLWHTAEGIVDEGGE